MFAAVAVAIIVLLLLLTKCCGDSGNNVSKAPSIESDASIETLTIIVPNVIGKTQEEAESILKDVGFEVNVVEEYDANIEAGKATNHSHTVDSAQLPNTTVTINISIGKQSVKVMLNANGEIVNVEICLCCSGWWYAET